MTRRTKAKVIAMPVRAPKRDYKIVAEMHHRSQEWQDKGRRMTRKYVNVDNALDAAERWMRHYGRVGSVIVVHNLEGFELGTIKMNARGSITTKWWLE